MTTQTQPVTPAKHALDLLNSVSSPDLRSAELDEKWSRLASFLDREKLSAILLRRHDNIAWATAGQVEARVAILAETGVASLLLTRDGRKFYLFPNNESARLADEEFSSLPYEPVSSPWYQNPNSIDAVRRIVGEGTIGTDTAAPGFTPVNIASLRAPLTTAEAARYRWVAQRTAEATAQTLVELEPGITEYEMAGRVAQSLHSQGILPSVLLMAVDDRIRKYKHAVSRGAVLERYGMLNLCSRKWGLAVSITRFVHFGPPQQQLVDGFAACAEINAQLLHASRSGVTSAELFAVAQRAYSATGYPGEEQLHHQGGTAAYLEREWVATPNGQEALTGSDALAWNCSIRGAKVEDTALLQNNVIEIMTLTPSLPVIVTKVEGIAYPAADVLIR
jgi:Xaa-Pro dipeptidase